MREGPLGTRPRGFGVFRVNLGKFDWLSHPVSGGVIHFLFLRGDVGGVLSGELPRVGRSGVSGVGEEVRR